MNWNVGVSEFVFMSMIIATYIASIIARAHSRDVSDDDLAERSLNRWLVGLSAGTTANSGFIVTAAVGLGYVYGMQWVLLPISWLLGDLVFWSLFPERINDFGRKEKSTTLSELLKAGLSGRASSILGKMSAVIIVVCLAGYTAAQWIAGEKFLSGAFGLSGYTALGLFAVMIIAYSSIGGFRGSVYTDTLQAVIRIAGTLIAIVAIVMAAMNSENFTSNLAAAGSDFLKPYPVGGVFVVIGFIVGFAFTAIGFGLGQPQIVTRYLAGRDPQETKAAKWIYIGFVQFTWIAMTLFGVMLRGVMPNLSDPEAGLSIFFQSNINAVAAGLIAADIFATIASTSNGLLISMAQAVKFDMLPSLMIKRVTNTSFTILTLVMGFITMMIAILISGNVVALALSSVSLMGAGLAFPVMVKVMRWQHSAISLIFAIIAGVVSAILWKYSGMGAYFNEAGIGMLTSACVNTAICRWESRKY